MRGDRSRDRHSTIGAEWEDRSYQSGPFGKSTCDPIDRNSSIEKKIALFRRLFRGRSDVFPIRWENRTTRRSGYAPACANEWQRGICEKPKVKCSACPNQAFQIVNDVSIERHLRGVDANGAPFVMRVYPMLADNTCSFLAADFDEGEWRRDISAWSILGANDYYMAHALVGTLDPMLTRMPGSNYAATLLEWQHRRRRYADQGLSFVNGTLLHYWHGNRRNRGYSTRWKILYDHPTQLAPGKKPFEKPF